MGMYKKGRKLAQSALEILKVHNVEEMRTFVEVASRYEDLVVVGMSEVEGEETQKEG